MIKLLELTPKILKNKSLSDKDYVLIAKEMLNAYGVGDVKIKVSTRKNYKNLAEYHYENKSVIIYPSTLKNINKFLLTMLHEILHMLDHKKLKDKFITQYEDELSKADTAGTGYYGNSFEARAEAFAKKEVQKWIKKYL